MTRERRLPVFQSSTEKHLYPTVPKWQLWEAAVRLAARAAGGKADANLKSGKAATRLMDEIAEVVKAHEPVRTSDERGVMPSPDAPRGNADKSSDGSTPPSSSRISLPRR